MGDAPVKAHIDYRTFYSTSNTLKLLKKPIILIDGFDPQNARKIEACDCQADIKCRDANSKNGLFDANYESIVYSMQYFNPILGGPDNVLDNLRNKGFDVIIVDQPSYDYTNNGVTTKVDGGADYIERNAMALVSLIKSVNNKVASNGSTEKLVLLGPSMGGLISRYALAFMEKKFAETNIASWQHNTRLWVSIDSPHLGANVPLGDQGLFNLVRGDNVKAREFYEEKLRSPAAQEMLIEQHREGASYNTVNPNYLNAQISSQGMTSNTGNPYFVQHFNNHASNGLPNSNGFPMNLRKIALVNGSLTGSKNTVDVLGNQTQPFANDGQAIISLRGFQRLRLQIPFTNIGVNLDTLIAVLETYNMPTNGTYARITRYKKGFDDRTTSAPNVNV